MSILASAEQCIMTQMKGLEALRASLDGQFETLVNRIAALKGRVILSGMGKSGHIARKIAATLASTGTPAMFVHPAEASHGDLGMITPQDLVILLSNSGETKELQDIVYYCKRFSIPLVGLVRRKTSMLVEASDFAFVLPEIAEAASVNAPTTSTTMMLVWGDALAVALLDLRGFTAQDFHTYHPGGKLGSQFIKVEDLMRTMDALPLVKADTKVQDVLLTITEKSLGCAAVLDKQETLLGIITDGDLRRHMQQDLLGKNAQDIMTQNPITIHRAMLASEALHIMNTKNITSLCVLSADKKLLGIIHIHDLLRAGV